MNEILELVKQKDDLPALPDIIAHIDRKLNDPDSSLQEISRLIETDPVMAGKIIKLSNSAFYSAGRLAVTNLPMAIGRLGLNEIRNVVYSFSLLQLFDRSDQFDQRKFWNHCLAVAFTSQSLSRILGGDELERDLAYTAGLMHDVGILVFAHLMPDAYGEFLGSLPAGEDAKPLYQMENEKFFINHALLGAAYIKEWWPVDQIVILAVQEHHNSSEDDKFVPLTSKIVQVANEYCNAKGAGNGINPHKKELDLSCFAKIGMNEEQVNKFLEEGEEIIELSEAIISF